MVIVYHTSVSKAYRHPILDAEQKFRHDTAFPARRSRLETMALSNGGSMTDESHVPEMPYTICDTHDGLIAPIFFSQLQTYGIKSLLDVRLKVPDEPELLMSRTNLAFLCEQMGIRYLRDEGILPSFESIMDTRTMLLAKGQTGTEIMQDFHRRYAAELHAKQPELTVQGRVINIALRKGIGVAILGHEKDPELDYRWVIASFLQSLVATSRIVYASEQAAIRGTPVGILPDQPIVFSDLAKESKVIPVLRRFPEGKSWRESLPGMKVHHMRAYVDAERIPTAPVYIAASRIFISKANGLVLVTDKANQAIRCPWDDLNIYGMLEASVISYDHTHERPVTVECTFEPTDKSNLLFTPRVTKFHF